MPWPYYCLRHLLRRFCLPLLLCILFLSGGWAQQQRQRHAGTEPAREHHTGTEPTGQLQQHRIVSYNVENLFDCSDDTLKADDEYLPQGQRRWTPRRYHRKLNEVAKTLLALGYEGEAPSLVGLYEVENEQVLEALTRQTPLRSAGYRYVITSSADVRGIDVALLYRPDCFRLLSTSPLRANLPGERPTRDVLHITGLLFPALHDTLDLFLLHLPSRMSGAQATEPYRCHVAHAVRQAIDSLCHIRLRPCFLLMGDFNEGPYGKAITHTLRAKPLAPQPHQRHQKDAQREQEDTIILPSDTTLYQLLSPRRPSSLRTIKGSYKYQGHWELIDHLLASGALLHRPTALPAERPIPRLHLLPTTAEVAPLPFLLTDDRLYGGQCPLRTYYGATYLGGPSDHLPLVVDCCIEE